MLCPRPGETNLVDTRAPLDSATEQVGGANQAPHSLAKPRPRYATHGARARCGRMSQVRPSTPQALNCRGDNKCCKTT